MQDTGNRRPGSGGILHAYFDERDARVSDRVSDGVTDRRESTWLIFIAVFCSTLILIGRE